MAEKKVELTAHDQFEKICIDVAGQAIATLLKERLQKRVSDLTWPEIRAMANDAVTAWILHRAHLAEELRKAGDAPAATDLLKALTGG